MDGPMLYLLLKDFGIRKREGVFEVVKFNKEKHTLKHIKSFERVEDAIGMIVDIFNKREARRGEYGPVGCMVLDFAIKDVLSKCKEQENKNE